MFEPLSQYIYLTAWVHGGALGSVATLQLYGKEFDPGLKLSKTMLRAVLNFPKVVLMVPWMRQFAILVCKVKN